jgi:modulator of FtsH protease
MDAVLHNIGVFFHHLAAVGWTSLGLALVCQFVKLACVSRAWRNILVASYPQSEVPWRTVWGAILARVGINAIVPARGGDVAGLFIVKRRVEGATLPTLATSLVALTLFDSVAASCFIVYALAAGELPGRTVLARLPGFDFGWLFDHLQGALIVFGIVLLFVAIPGGNIIYALLGLVIFGAYSIFDFNRLKRADMSQAIPIAASIFLDIFNVLLLFLSLFGGGSRN